MSNSQSSYTLVAFDVGEKRIGVAQADTSVRIAFPLKTITVDGSEQQYIQQLLTELKPHAVVVGMPRNQSGEQTAQSRVSEQFAKGLEVFGVPVTMQDESVTSVLAEDYLKQQRKPYTKADIDARAAAIILQDYIEAHYG